MQLNLLEITCFLMGRFILVNFNHYLFYPFIRNLKIALRCFINKSYPYDTVGSDAQISPLVFKHTLDAISPLTVRHSVGLMVYSLLM